MGVAARALLIGTVATVVSIVGAPVASAHADYRDSDPPDGASVSSPPGEVWAEFTEQPVEGSTIVITDPCGQRVDKGDYRYQPFPINRITVSMSADKAGAYRATWTVTSDADGHTTRGTFTFTSTGGEACPGAESGSKGSSGSAERSSSTSGDESAQQPEVAADTSDAGSAGSTAQRTGKPSGKDGAKQARGKKGRVKSEQADLAQAPQEENADLVAEEEDIPLDWLVVGLLISALIGAAGGRVYVNIVAPRGKGDQSGRPSNSR